MNPVIYVFVNKSLGMSAGKLAAQVGHAVAMVPQKYVDQWNNAPHRTILVMEGRNELHMRNVRAYLEERGIHTQGIIDEGANEIDPHVLTALATDVLNKDDENVQKTMSTFKLYRDPIKVTLEIDR